MLCNPQPADSQAHIVARSGFQIILAISAIAFLFGCSSAPPKKKRAKLSDAVEQAAKDPDEQKKLKPDKYKGDDDPNQDDDDVETGSAVGGVLSLADDDPGYEEEVGPEGEVNDREGWHLGLVAGAGTLTGGDVDGFGMLGLQGGVTAPRQRIRGDVRVLAMRANLHEESLLAQGLKNEAELGLDLGLRYYFTPEHTFVGLYVHGGYRFGVLFWSYENPVEIVEGGDTITIENDGIVSNSLFVGLGTSLVQTDHFHMGGNVSVGYKFYVDTTLENFENDLFSDEPFLQFMIDLTFGSM